MTRTEFTIAFLAVTCLVWAATEGLLRITQREHSDCYMHKSYYEMLNRCRENENCTLTGVDLADLEHAGEMMRRYCR